MIIMWSPGWDVRSPSLYCINPSWQSEAQDQCPWPWNFSFSIDLSHFTIKCIYGTRIKKVNALRAYYATPTATGVLRRRLRAYYADGYGRTTPSATGVLRLRLRAYCAYGYGRTTPTATACYAYGYGRTTLTATGVSWLQLRPCYRGTMRQGVS